MNYIGDLAKPLKKSSYEIQEKTYADLSNLIRFKLYSVLKDEYLVEDAINEVFIKLMDIEPGYFLDKNVKAWVQKIAYHIAIDLLRKYRDKPFDKNLLEAMREKIYYHDDFSLEREFEFKMKINFITSQVNQLDYECKKIFYMKYILDITSKRISWYLNMKESTLSRKLKRIRETLSYEFKKQWG